MGQQHQSGERPSLATLGADLWTSQCHGERIDTLARLPSFRLLYLRQRRAGHELAFTEYGRLLQRAMKPVRLPRYEPERYLDRLMRSDPVAAEVFAPLLNFLSPRAA